VLSPELPSFSADLASKHELTFPILNDHGCVIARMYGLAFTLPDDLRDVYLNTFKNDLAKRKGSRPGSCRCPRASLSTAPASSELPTSIRTTRSAPSRRRRSRS
jgi:hypothetical protein